MDHLQEIVKLVKMVLIQFLVQLHPQVEVEEQEIQPQVQVVLVEEHMAVVELRLTL